MYIKDKGGAYMTSNEQKKANNKYRLSLTYMGDSTDEYAKKHYKGNMNRYQRRTEKHKLKNKFKKGIDNFD